MNNMIKNKARGRKKKREIKKIDDKSSRQVTFCKRRVGVFSKASELCVLTGAEGVVLCESLGGRVYAFAHPSVESVVDRYLADKSSSELVENNSAATETNVNFPPCMHDEMNKQYLELTKEIEIEKNKSEKVIGGISDDSNNNNNINMEEGDLFWWQQPFEHLEEEELEEYISSMEVLMNKLKLRANDMMLIRSSSSMFDASDALNLNDSGLSDENLANKNLKMKEYGSPHEFFANKNTTTMDYGLQDELFANKNLTTKDYAMMEEFFANKNMTTMDGLPDKYLANKDMTMMEYGLPDEFFVTTKDYGLPDEFFANKNLTTKDYGFPDEFFANKNPTTTDYVLPDEFSVNRNLNMNDHGLLDEFFANNNMNVNDGMLNEFLAIKDPNFNDEVDHDYSTDLELPLVYGNNLQVPNIGCNSTGNEVQLSQTDSNLAVPDNYGKATDLPNFGTDVFPDYFSFSCDLST